MQAGNDSYDDTMREGFARSLQPECRFEPRKLDDFTLGRRDRSKNLAPIIFLYFLRGVLPHFVATQKWRCPLKTRR